MMLESILFLKEWRCFKEEVFDFRAGVNLLVGDQGTGKSSLYQAITVCGIQKPKSVYLPSRESVPAMIVYKGDPIRVCAFDFEHDNHRTKTWFDDDIGFHVAAMYHSHGEMVMAMIDAWLSINEPMIVLADEPDMALSIRSCYRLVEAFQHVAKQGGQVFASAHNPIVIMGFEEVLSLEHRKWMSSREFIETQKYPREQEKSDGPVCKRSASRRS